MVPTAAGSLLPYGRIPTGDGPSLLAVAPGGTVYVSNQGDQTITAWDPAAHETTTFSSLPGPWALAVSPDGELLYVLHAPATGPYVVDMIRTADRARVGQVRIDHRPGGEIALSPSGTRLYVATSAGITVINTFNQSIVTKVSFGGRPTGVAVTPDGSRVYVTGQESDTVTVIDTATNTVARTIPVGPEPYYGIAITPDGRRAYVPNHNDGMSPGTVSVIDTDPGSGTYHAVVATVAVELAPVSTAVSPDGSVVYVAGSLGSLTIIDVATGEVVRVISLGERDTYDVAASPDGEYVYVNSLLTDHVLVFRVAPPELYTIVDTISVPDHPQSVEVNPIDGSLWVTSPDLYVSFVDPDRTATNFGAQFDHGIFDVEFSRDGRSAYLTWRNQAVQVFDTASRTPIGLIATPGATTYVETDPNGTFAYVANVGGSAETVTVIDTATNAIVRSIRLPNVSADALCVSPDGAYIYLVDERSGNVLQIDGATGSLAKTIVVGDAFNFVVVSPDGKTLYTVDGGVASAGSSARARVSVIDVASGAVSKIELNGLTPWNPILNSDGTRLYVAQSEWNSVAVIDTTVRRLISVVNVGRNPRGMAISTNGEFLYVGNFDDGTVSVMKIA